MRTVLSAVVICLSASATFAQTQADARRALLPYIRSATNCIAEQALQDPSAVAAYRRDTWHDVLSTASSRCSPQVNEMLVVHDRIHGLGTGQTFYRGPYWDDLPRAIKARIGGELSSRADRQRADDAQREARAIEEEALRRQSIARAATDRAERLQTLAASRDLIRDRMIGCIGERLVELSSSGESATVLAKAAITLCDTAMESFLKSAIEYAEMEDGAKYNRAQSDAIRTAARTMIEDRAMAEAVRQRAKPASAPGRGA